MPKNQVVWDYPAPLSRPSFLPACLSQVNRDVPSHPAEESGLRLIAFEGWWETFYSFSISDANGNILFVLDDATH